VGAPAWRYVLVSGFILLKQSFSRASGGHSAPEGLMTTAATVKAEFAGVLDPQGKAIQRALGNLGFAGVGEVRVGKVMIVEVAETDPAAAKAAGEEMARRLLANTVIENFTIESVG